MALNLYCRHGSCCEGRHSPQEMTYESDEGRRSWKKCFCPIYASGTLGGQFKRRNSEHIAWVEAKAFASQLVASGNWDGKISPAPPQVAPAAQWKSSCWSRPRLWRRTPSENARPFLPSSHLIPKPKDSCYSNSGRHPVREFRSQWIVSPVTSAKNMAAVKAFFEFAVGNRWFLHNPARSVRNIRGHDVEKERIPFTTSLSSRMADTQGEKSPVLTEVKEVDIKQVFRGESVC